MSVSCIQSTMSRLSRLDSIRQKQGYYLARHLLRYNKKIDVEKLKEKFLSLGLLLTESEYACIFRKCTSSKDPGVLDVELFTAMLNDSEKSDLDNIAAKLAVHRDRTTLTAAAHTSMFTADGKCRVSENIMGEYFVRLERGINKVFNIFDIDDTGQVPTMELERLVESLGYNCRDGELFVLVSQLDPMARGIIMYQDYIKVMLPYMKEQASKFKLLTFERLLEAFKRFDLDGSGTLDYYEFKYAIQSCGCNAATYVTDEECDAIISYIDNDNDGIINFDEFATLYSAMNKNIHSVDLNLPVVVRTGIIKIIYSSLPDPERHNLLYAGLPSNYRKSVLADVANNKSHSFSKILNNKLESTASKSELFLEMQLNSVQGLPIESTLRSRDIVSRGLRYCVCQTDKPATADEPGNPPEFLGNVGSMSAISHHGYADKWSFTLNENKDPDSSFFVKCFANEPYVHPNGRTHSVSVPGSYSAVRSNGNEQLYLYVELITTVKIRKEMDVKDIKKEAIRYKELLKSKSYTANAPTQPNAKTVPAGSNKENINANTSSTSNTIATTNSPPAVVLPQPVVVTEQQRETDLKNEALLDTYLPSSVELCSAWCMIPIGQIATAFAGPSNTLPSPKQVIPMHGGTPFYATMIRKEDIQVRSGVWNMFKRAIGYDVKSQLSVLIAPVTISTRSGTPGVAMISEKVVDYLPENIILPSKIVSSVGIFRCLMTSMQQQYLSLDSSRVLPQSGCFLPFGDVLLSSFPKLLSDTCAAKVMMLLWAREAPQNIGTLTDVRNISVSEATNPSVLKVFREVVLRVWRAYSSPEADKPKHIAVESYDDIIRRQDKLKEMIGMEAKPVPPPPSMLQSTGSKVASTIASGMGVKNSGDMLKSMIVDQNRVSLSEKPLLDHLYKPFHSRELMWDSTKCISDE